MPHATEPSFTGPAEIHSFNGFLFDMDGTIIDSTSAIIKHWTKIGNELGIDPNVILATSHGRRSIDVLREHDPSKATYEYVAKIEGELPKQFGADAVELPGSRAMLDELQALGVPWAIVTSGTYPLVTGWLDVMKLAHPQHLVSAEAVENGKPDPACYRLGYSKLGIEMAERLEPEVLVLEDAPAGVKAGKAAGFRVCALVTTHEASQLKEAGADWIVRDMRSVKVKEWDAEKGVAKVEISETLQD
ncbi:HAD-like protein [Rhizodiscina lignyota]|uniref:HAD-like protein n=1 Tax=Rhizodiscina lignyota TaxID=1504668 RepID=A0A9P4M1N2_9PEZI|nr:HAD-like protein [Rhizodiscina lignyota]